MGIIAKAFEAIERMKRLEISDKFDKEMDKIAKWNKKTFPHATMSGQLMKLEEELREFEKAKTTQEHRNEMADIFIVLGGLKRRDCLIGNFMRNKLFDDMHTCVLKSVLKAIRRKMEINRKRTWVKSGDGKFQHSNKE